MEKALLRDASGRQHRKDGDAESAVAGATLRRASPGPILGRHPATACAHVEGFGGKDDHANGGVSRRKPRERNVENIVLRVITLKR
jgi:hypothetical protein